jgi:methionyl-tRNA formyltransferase
VVHEAHAMSLRVIFMGTPDFAVPTLSALIGYGHEVVACYTRAPAPAGRGMALKLSPVHEAANRFAIPVLTPTTLRDADALETFRAHEADVAIVVAYGMLLPKALLDVPPLGCLNLHASLLPRWRGAAPIQRAIMSGDAETGVAVMKMEEGLDTGPVAMVERLPITDRMTAGEAHDRLAVLGADLMARALAALSRGTLAFSLQPEAGVVYARKITNDEGRIDWTRPARDVLHHIHGLSPFPGAFTFADFGKGPERVKILRAEFVDRHGSPGTLLDDALCLACGQGALRLVELQRAGSKPMAAADFLRGVSLPPGAVFG